MITITELYTIYQKHSQVFTDSRKVIPDGIFFALKGPNFNGNKYATQALEEGAAFAVIDEASFQINDRCLLVDNVLKSLQQLARHHRRQFNFPVLAITGSNGKTTTKELVSTVLESHYKTHYTKGNFNNHIGVPLTLLAMSATAEIAVIEMGANHPGEIAELSEIAEPSHGLITNIGKAHLEGFGDLEGVKKTKSELYRFLAKDGGVAFVNKDEAFLEDLAKDNNHKCFYFESSNPDRSIPHLETTLVDVNPYVELSFVNREGETLFIQSHLMGLHNFNNLMTAVAIGRYFKVPAQKIKTAIENYIPSNNRSQLIQRDTNNFILDAYNANPSSMQKALQSFDKLAAKNKVAILGDMLELGEESLTEHQEILDYSKQLELNQVILVGKEFSKIKDLKDKGAKHFDHVSDLKVWFDQQSFEQTWFLVKGSRGIKLEQLLAITDGH